MLPINKYYRLYVVKEVSVTESFLTLREETRKCQKKITFDECTTQRYIRNLKLKCGCLPYQLRLSPEASFLKKIHDQLFEFPYLTTDIGTILQP